MKDSLFPSFLEVLNIFFACIFLVFGTMKRKNSVYDFGFAHFWEQFAHVEYMFEENEFSQFFTIFAWKRFGFCLDLSTNTHERCAGDKCFILEFLKLFKESLKLFKMRIFAVTQVLNKLACSGNMRVVISF